MPRPTSNKRAALSKKLRTIHAVQANLTSTYAENGMSAQNIKDYNRDNPSLCKTIDGLLTYLTKSEDTPFQDQIDNLLAETKSSIKAIATLHKKAFNKRMRSKQQKLISKSPKAAHKQIFGTATNRSGLKALKDPNTGLLETKPSKIASIIEEFYTSLLRPVTIKSGLYLPEQAPRNFPWEQPGALDPFKLETPVTADERTPGRPKRRWLHSSILDKTGFHECLRSLSNNKSPGPDGIVKVLTMLPPEARDIIHKLFIVMWATGVTPKAWKVSDTILVDNERDLKPTSPHTDQLAWPLHYIRYGRPSSPTPFMSMLRHTPSSAPPKLASASKRTLSISFKT